MPFQAFRTCDVGLSQRAVVASPDVSTDYISQVSRNSHLSKVRSHRGLISAGSKTQPQEEENEICKLNVDNSSVVVRLCVCRYLHD